MKLRDLLKFNQVVVQCHDNPDADAIASGYGVYLYLREQGKDVRFVYSGRNKIRKSNLVMMIKELEIPIEYVDTIAEAELLVLVDCQQEGGNVETLKGKTVAVIDHHRVNKELPSLSEVRSTLGACSTLVWKLLLDEGYPVNENKKLTTALYYGLYTDTGSFAEISHPLDKDLRDEADCDQALITKFRNANLSIEELETAGAALLRSDYNEKYRFAIVKCGSCDPNLLGIISDLVLEVDAVDICLVFSMISDGVKLSVRSCVKEVKASELAAEICKGIGSGGGHLVKAGGFIPMELMVEAYKTYCKEIGASPRMELSEDGKSERPSMSGVKSFLEQKMMNYFDNSEIIYTDKYEADINKMGHYRKKPLPLGYIYATDLFKPNTKITIRSFEGDVDARVEEDSVIMIGANGKVYINSREAFEKTYRTYPNWNYTLKDTEYSPTIKDNDAGKTIHPLKFAKVCIPTGEYTIYAKRIDHRVKIFMGWNENSYLLGEEGDYLAVRGNDVKDVYIIDGKVFAKGYVEEEEMIKHKNEQNKAVIFDLDGTLLDTLEDLKNAVNAALKEYHMPERTLDEIREFVGNGIRNLMIKAVPDGEINPKFEDAFAFFQTYYGAHCKENTAPYEGVLCLMKELATRGIKMAIVSNKIDSGVKELNEEHFAEYTQAAIGEMPGVERKPAPDMVEKALQILGVEKENTIYVGDSDVDIATARNAGLKCISVTWGFRDANFLKKHGAEVLIDHPQELLELV